VTLVDLINGCHKYRPRAAQSELLKMSLNILVCEVGLTPHTEVFSVSHK
jgi:hypothetical protein